MQVWVMGGVKGGSQGHLSHTVGQGGVVQGPQSLQSSEGLAGAGGSSETSVPGHTAIFTRLCGCLRDTSAGFPKNERYKSEKKEKATAFCDLVLEVAHCHLKQVTESRPQSKEGELSSTS